MLNKYAGLADATSGASPMWYDLCDPDEGEIADIEAVIGSRLPSRDALSEIESSSRLRVQDGILSVSIPMISRPEHGPVQDAPIGILLLRYQIVTIRFSPLAEFDAVAERYRRAPAPGLNPVGIFSDLCDEIVDRLADRLEQAASELRKLSMDAFHLPEEHSHKAIRSNRQLRAKLRYVGRIADRLSETRDVLLGVGRAVDFVCEGTRSWSDRSLEPRISSLQRDVASLDEYEVHLSDKAQFLLDAMVGLIGIAQNEVFKVLTIVSIVGIPPTLVAGIYGMNFKNMPEYNWAFGYPYGLAVIALSALLPLVWFKWRGWF